MTTRNLKIGTLVIPLLAALELEQTYGRLGGQFTRRKMSGAAHRQTHWQKLTTTITGRGWVPAPLLTLDTGAQHTVECVMPVCIAGSATSITLPTAARSGSAYTPYARALLPSGEMVDTPVSVTGTAATVATVTGAVQYECHYWPSFTALVTVEDMQNDFTNNYGFSITAEQV